MKDGSEIILGGGVSDEADWPVARAASAMAALAHPVRLKILEELARRDACCVKDVVRRVGLAQSTVSQHIKVLVNAGIVSYRPERQTSLYSLDRASMRSLAGDIQALFALCCAEDAGRAGCSESMTGASTEPTSSGKDQSDKKKST